MDKLSAVLAGVICLLIGLSAATACGTWGKNGQEAFPAELPVLSQEGIREEMELAEIAINDDAQVINGGGEDMWIRVQIELLDQDSREGGAMRTGAQVTQPDAEQLRKGAWQEEGGYYYYSLPVEPGEQTAPLPWPFDTDPSAGRADVGVRAEGIQVNWIKASAENGKQAFDLFERYLPVEAYKGSFV